MRVTSTGKALTLDKNGRDFFKFLSILAVAKDNRTRETVSKPK